MTETRWESGLLEKPMVAIVFLISLLVIVFFLGQYFIYASRPATLPILGNPFLRNPVFCFQAEKVSKSAPQTLNLTEAQFLSTGAV